MQSFLLHDFPQTGTIRYGNQRPRCKQRGIKLAALQSSGVLTLAAVAKYPHECGYLARCSRE